MMMWKLMKTCSVVFYLFVCLCTLLPCHVSEARKCSTCKKFTEGFEKGLERTKKSNFGGGNTHWEEKSLGSWANSETRLVDILERVCDDDKDCHFLLEKYEEEIEDYWFNVFPKETKEDMHTWFCISKITLCCPTNTYGPSCKDCPGGKERPCRGNGKCDGEGTRKGKGKCKCDTGYHGDLCDECKDGYFEVVQNETHTQCEACHTSCQSTCWEAGPKGCDECKKGWTLAEEQGCVDVNECTEESPCKEDQYCSNNPGSYSCFSCHSACQGCTDFGVTQCIECKAGYRLVDKACTDINECEEEAGLCIGDKMLCHNTAGSFECQCEDGYVMDEEEKCIPKPKEEGEEEAAGEKEEEVKTDEELKKKEEL